MLRQSERAPGLLLGEQVELPDSVELGARVTIHAGTRIGEHARVQDGAVLGKPLALGPRSTASRDEPPPLVVGSAATVGAAAVVVAGAELGAGCVVADQAHVRERVSVGERSTVGRGAAVENDVWIGADVRIQTGCYVTAFSVIEDEVFVGPCATTTNDNTLGRRPAGMALTGATLRHGCRVGAAAVLLPGVEVGAEALVAAGALLTRDVPPRAVAMGIPARIVRELSESELGRG